MGKSYYRKPEMVEGGQFRCHNCNNLFAEELVGSNYKIKLTCERCKTEVVATCKEPIPFVAEQLSRQKAQDAP